jgi:hypothetical protein
MRIFSGRIRLATIPRPRGTLHAAACGALLGALLLSACGGGGGHGTATGSDSTSAASIPPVPGVHASMNHLTVVLPVGISAAPDRVSVVTSVGEATPDASGTISVAAYLNGSQLAIVLSPSGNPMLMGWVDATHTTISAASTAQVLAYFALNGPYLLHSEDAQALIAALSQAPNIAAVEAAVSSELLLNVDAFAQPNPVLSTAVSNFAKAIFTSVNKASATASRAHIHAITITPDVQSGITVLQDPPFAAHLANSFRRRAFAFVDRVSYSVGSVVTPDPQTVASFEVSPVIGVNGGVTGALTDIMAAYWGNQPTAYASVVAPDTGTFAVPLVAGSDKTTYQVTVVGAGSSAGVTNLTDTQSTALTEVALRGFVTDFLVPTFANAILGSGAIDFKAGQSTSQAGFYADLVASATTDFITFVSSATYDKTKTKIINGQWFDAGVDITSTVAGSNSLRSILVQAFNVAVNKAAASGATFGAAATFMDKFNSILNAAGGALQVFDSTVYASDLARSDRADQWTLTVGNSPVKLNPAASNINVGGTVVLTTSVPGVEDTSGYSYHWTTTTNVGDLNEIGGGGRTHQTDYCSSSNEALFVYETGATPNATDTVTVQAYSGPNCDVTKGVLLGSASAIVTFAGTTVNIVLTQPWTDTGRTVTSGQQLTIKTTGIMDYWTGGCPSTQDCNVTPDGLPWSTCEGSTAGPYLTPGLACFSLVGRIGANGAPFEVGSNFTFTVPSSTSGELYLGVNDNNYPDNTGTWTSVIN